MNNAGLPSTFSINCDRCHSTNVELFVYVDGTIRFKCECDNEEEVF